MGKGGAWARGGRQAPRGGAGPAPGLSPPARWLSAAAPRDLRWRSLGAFAAWRSGVPGKLQFPACTEAPSPLPPPTPLAARSAEAESQQPWSFVAGALPAVDYSSQFAAGVTIPPHRAASETTAPGMPRGPEAPAPGRLGDHSSRHAVLGICVRPCVVALGWR